MQPIAQQAPLYPPNLSDEPFDDSQVDSAYDDYRDALEIRHRYHVQFASHRAVLAARCRERSAYLLGRYHEAIAQNKRPVIVRMNLRESQRCLVMAALYERGFDARNMEIEVKNA